MLAAASCVECTKGRETSVSTHSLIRAGQIHPHLLLGCSIRTI